MSTIKNRPAGIAKRAFRVIRNGLAVLGVCFVYLLVLGYMQYVDREASRDMSCSYARCM